LKLNHRGSVGLELVTILGRNF